MADLWLVRANHELSHALVALLVGLRVEICTIDPSHPRVPAGAGGFTAFAPHTWDTRRTEDILHAMTTATVAPASMGGTDRECSADYRVAEEQAEFAGVTDPLGVDDWISRAVLRATRITASPMFRGLYGGDLGSRLLEELTLEDLTLDG